MREEKSLLQHLYTLGEEKLSRLAKDVLANPKFTESFGKALQKAAVTKGRVDRNIDLLLGLLNLPSKADYNKLLAKVEALQGSLVNVNMKIDRLLAEREKPKPVSKKRAAS